MSTLTRRILGKGAAWSLPVIAAAAAVPAVAASARPQLAVSGRVNYNSTWYSDTVDHREDFKVFSLVPDTNVPGRGYRVTDSRKTTSIGPLSITFYLPTRWSDLSFSSGAIGYRGWSLLARDSTKTPKRSNGITFYPFTTRYAADLVAVEGTTYWPPFSFESEHGLELRADYFFVEHRGTVDGEAVELDYGPVAMPVMH